MTRNVGGIDRIIRLIVGLLLIAAPFVTNIALFQSTIGMIVSLIIGVVLLTTAILRTCPLNKAFGINTAKD